MADSPLNPRQHLASGWPMSPSAPQWAYTWGVSCVRLIATLSVESKLMHLGLMVSVAVKVRARFPDTILVEPYHQASACFSPYPFEFILEPQGLARSDNKRPAGLTITPWASGRRLVWDVTCWDSFAPSYISLSSSGAGLVAERPAHRKRDVYKELTANHIIPITFESTGVFGKDALLLTKEIARRSRLVTYDQLSYLKLCQHLSVCIQNFNCASILGCSQ